MMDALQIAITPAALIAGALIGSRRLRLDRKSDLGLRVLPAAFHVVGNTFAVLPRL